MKRAVGVIPARWGSTRFPGKMLTPLGGTPLIVWVWRRARLARVLDEVLVATDDNRIAEAVAAEGGRAVMTRSDHPSGTDRIAEAVQDISADVVVNIQGDEPLIDPDLIDRCARCLQEDATWDLATAAVPLTGPDERNRPGSVKVVRNEQGGALYFSRAAIPFNRDEVPPVAGRPDTWRHLGLYAYRRDALHKLVASPPCRLEILEQLEQLRALHLGMRIKVLEARDTGPGVDTPEDAVAAEEALRREGLLPGF